MLYNMLYSKKGLYLHLRLERNKKTRSSKGGEQQKM